LNVSHRELWLADAHCFQAAFLNLFLNFFIGLPKEEIRGDGRSENGNDVH